MIKYLAGIFDSEGHVRIRKNMSGKNYSYTYECRIEMTNREIIDLFSKRYNLKVYEYNRPNSNNKTSYSITLNGKQLRESDFINDLLPYLNEKYYQLKSIQKIILGENKEQCYQEYMEFKKSFNHNIVNKPSYEYLAGIIDGDGCLSMFNAGKGQGRSMYNKYSVSLEGRYEAIIEYMSSTYGGSSVIPRKINSDKHIQTYSWQITNEKMLDLLMGIQPYLIEKKLKCQILINYITKFMEFRKFSEQTLQLWTVD